MLRFGLAAAAVAAAVTVAVVLFGVPGVRDSGPQVSLAAQVLAKMSGSLGAVRSFTADDIGVDYQNGDTPVTSRSRVYLAANGDGRVEDEHGKWAVIHNAALGTQWTLERVDGRLVATQVSTGLPAGNVFSNPGDSSNYFLGAGYGTALRALLAAGQEGMDVRTSTLNGRPSWTVTFADHSAKSLEIRLVVDQETGLVFGSSSRENGHRCGSTTWRTCASTNRSTRRCSGRERRSSLSEARARRRKDDGFKRVALSGVEGIVGYAPVVPAQVPDGFTLTDVTASPSPPAARTDPATALW